MSGKSAWVRTGDFFFRWRNIVFPILIFTDIALFPPRWSTLSDPRWGHLAALCAVALVAAGLGLRAAVIGFAYIKRGGLNKKVHADTLVTEGFFAAGRNPLYLANMLIYSGVFLLQGGVFAVLGPLVFFAIYSAIIAAEEHFLRARFGEAYEDYCRATPRWGLRRSALPAALAGMDYDWRRVVAKDYTTFANAVLALILVAVAGDVARDGLVILPHEIATWGLACLGLGLAVLVIRMLKKRTELLHA